LGDVDCQFEIKEIVTSNIYIQCTSLKNILCEAVENLARFNKFHARTSAPETRVTQHNQPKVQQFVASKNQQTSGTCTLNLYQYDCIAPPPAIAPRIAIRIRILCKVYSFFDKRSFNSSNDRRIKEIKFSILEVDALAEQASAAKFPGRSRTKQQPYS
jgi:hypothetical protein